MCLLHGPPSHASLQVSQQKHPLVLLLGGPGTHGAGWKRTGLLCQGLLSEQTLARAVMLLEPALLS